MNRLAYLYLFVFALALACGRIESGSSGPSSDQQPPASQPPSAQPPPPTQATPSQATISFSRVGSRTDAVHTVTLDVVRVLAIHGATPARPADRAACAVAGARADAVTQQLALDVRSPGRTPFDRVDVDAGELGELRLLARGADVEVAGNHRRGHGRLTCIDDDGTELIVIRLLPAEHLELEGNDDLVALFDDQRHVADEACEVDDHGTDQPTCDPDDGQPHTLVADHGADDADGGSGGGGGGGGADDPPGHDQDGGSGGGGGGGGSSGGGGNGGGAHGSRLMIADELPLARAR
jgi:hypothetical protein